MLLFILHIRDNPAISGWIKFYTIFSISTTSTAFSSSSSSQIIYLNFIAFSADYISGLQRFNEFDWDTHYSLINALKLVHDLRDGSFTSYGCEIFRLMKNELEFFICESGIDH